MQKFLQSQNSELLLANQYPFKKALRTEKQQESRKMLATKICIFCEMCATDLTMNYEYMLLFFTEIEGWC
jgi:hypothetical protein